MASTFVSIFRNPWAKAAGIAGLLAVVLLGLILGLRTAVADWALAKMSAKLQQERGANLGFASRKWKGLSGLVLQDVFITVGRRDTLFRAQELLVEPRWAGLLRGKVLLAQLGVERAEIRLERNKGVANYDRLLNAKRKPGTDTSAAKSNALAAVHRSLGLLAAQLPNRLGLHQVNIVLKVDSQSTHVRIDSLDLYEGSLQGKWTLDRQPWHMTGSYQPNKRTMDLKLHTSHDTGFVPLPLLFDQFGLRFGLDSLHFVLKELEPDDEVSRLVYSARISNLRLYHRRLCENALTIASLQQDFQLRIGPKLLELDSSSTLGLNAVALHPYFKYAYLDKDAGQDTLLSFGVSTQIHTAGDWLKSLPHGAFTGLKGAEAEGKIQFWFRFARQSSWPRDSAVLVHRLETPGFRVLKYGQADISKLGGSFVHHPYGGGRSFTVGPENPNFSPLDRISTVMKKAVVACEDPDFYYHRGFSAGSMAEAVSSNLKRGGFYRGASTISMQLVKNVFLTHRKTMARKLEEIILVWLMESSGIANKDRLLEVYLNIIEWGPNVYGITEGARFYFGKHPMHLTIEESIFLVMIIPRPNSFMYFFDEDHNLAPHTEPYFQYVAHRLVDAKLLPEDQVINIMNEIELTGPALKQLRQFSASRQDQQERDQMKKEMEEKDEDDEEFENSFAPPKSQKPLPKPVIPAETKPQPVSGNPSPPKTPSGKPAPSGKNTGKEKGKTKKQ